jgi:hypothetical protein
MLLAIRVSMNKKWLLMGNGSEPIRRNVNPTVLRPLLNACHVMIKAELRV